MIRNFIALFLLAAASACASNELGDTDYLSGDNREVFGKAVDQNIAAQTVNPEGATGDVQASGARVGRATERYRSDTVEKPKRIDTRSNSGGGAGAPQGGGVK